MVTGVFAGANQLSLGEVKVLPGQVASSSQGPHWWQRLPCKLPTAHQEQFGAQYLAQGHFGMQLSVVWSWDLNQQPSNLLYLLSYSSPAQKNSWWEKIIFCFKRKPCFSPYRRDWKCLKNIRLLLRRSWLIIILRSPVMSGLQMLKHSLELWSVAWQPSGLWFHHHPFLL